MTQSPTPKRSLQIHLGQDLKAKWDIYNANAKASGKKPAKELREAIAALLKSAEKPDQHSSLASFRQHEEHPDEREKKRLEIRLTPSELDAVKECAAQIGCTAQQWIVSLIRANLTAAPQLVGKKECAALGESNYLLLKIGGNLNQIAKRINEGFPESLKAEDLLKLRSEIRVHCEHVSKALGAASERWSIRAK